VLLLFLSRLVEYGYSGTTSDGVRTRDRSDQHENQSYRQRGPERKAKTCTTRQHRLKNESEQIAKHNKVNSRRIHAGCTQPLLLLKVEKEDINHVIVQLFGPA